LAASREARRSDERGERGERLPFPRLGARFVRSTDDRRGAAETEPRCPIFLAIAARLWASHQALLIPTG
jgi:hypothetical protein